MTSTHRNARLVPASAGESSGPPVEPGGRSRPQGPDATLERVFSGDNLRRVVQAATKALEATRRERTVSPSLVSQLREQSESQARLLIENDGRFQTCGLMQELMERSEEAILQADQQGAIRLARLATLVANKVDPEILGEAVTNDLRGRAATRLGNAYRYGGELRAAAECLRHADSLLAAGTGDPLEKANLLSIRASLALATGAYAEALDLLSRAERIYQALDESQLLGKVFVQKASVVGWDDPHRGIALSFLAEDHLDSAQDARLFLVARHNRIIWMLDADQVEEAATLFEASRPLYRQFDDEWTLLHQGLAEARLALALEDLEEAEISLQVLLDELLARGQQLNAALCALDLADCYLLQGEPRKASELAAAMAQNLRAWGAHDRAREAWAVLQHALALERATGDLLRQLARYLHRAWRNPHLPFRPGLNTRSSPPILRS